MCTELRDVVVRLALFLRIREVYGSNLSRDTSYTDVFRNYTQPYQANVGIYFEIGHGRVISVPFAIRY